MGPAHGKLREVCDEAFCATPEGTYAAQCSVKDGACDDKVSCHEGTTNVTGSCP